MRVAKKNSWMWPRLRVVIPLAKWMCLQGRACEHLLAKVLVRPGTVVVTNYHFTTTKAHVVLQGGKCWKLTSRKPLRPQVFTL